VNSGGQSWRRSWRDRRHGDAQAQRSDRPIWQPRPSLVSTGSRNTRSGSHYCHPLSLARIGVTPTIPSTHLLGSQRHTVAPISTTSRCRSESGGSPQLPQELA